MSLAEVLALLMFASACLSLMAGYNVAFTLGGIALSFAALGSFFGVFDVTFLTALPGRIYPLITREILIAVPLFVFMGVMLERSHIAKDLLESMGDLLSNIHGGLGISVVVVGALLAASTGIIGATVVTMGLLSLPTMLQRKYDPALASGTIAASGTLGQIIPPSIVLIILGDQISNAYQEAQRSLNVPGNSVISVGDLFAAALIPGLVLVTLYASYIACIAFLRPQLAPAQKWPDDVKTSVFLKRTLIALLPPIGLIIAVLGSILSGYATPTRGAALGALGAILFAAYKSSPEQAGIRSVIKFTIVSFIGLILMDLTPANLHLYQEHWKLSERISVIIALGFSAVACFGTACAILQLYKQKTLAVVSRSTMHITCMVFAILIGATLFSLVFRGFGGDELVEHMLNSAPGGMWGALALVMLIMFLLGFFLDFIEITFVIVPLVAPPLIAQGADPIWLGILMALNLQTSFLTPPFGFALFYLRGVAPPEVTTGAIYRGILPFIFIQILVILMVLLFPQLATYLPYMITH